MEDILTPSDDLDDDTQPDDNTDPTEDDPAPVDITYTFGDADSLLYVQVYKDESAWGSGFAHNHVMRASNWYGYIDFNVEDINVCDFEFSLPVADLMVDEDAMRQYVGYGDTIFRVTVPPSVSTCLLPDQLRWELSNKRSHLTICMS